MGNREDLIAGAKRCLYDKGYARTSIRDITAAAGGVSMAAIGYHFGSKEALLNEALSQASQEWGEQLAQALSAVPDDPGAGPLQRFEAAWAQIIRSFDLHRPLWAATFDVIGQVQHAEQARAYLAAGLEHARLGLAQVLGGLDPASPNAWAVGGFYQALLTGVMAQHLIDPERAPTSHDLATALALISGRPVTERDAP
ncbi:TetR/AcrR family transcriptional regulator [Nonomuraea turcica]|uniref:TetR/AcrR family transcriptional regulator n=1 Tax=Nonomuraea sp. G32 TaxID=3067274 RepID=UPI00273A7DC4|nr:TetR/AcrR family transcriptional regulator [Nonomuraea sp. G32]MDP4503204.1 TetR/AcrR family transcriptional regulator [Nonomuraea sp. G32]